MSLDEQKREAFGSAGPAPTYGRRLWGGARRRRSGVVKGYGKVFNPFVSARGRVMNFDYLAPIVFLLYSTRPSSPPSPSSFPFPHSFSLPSSFILNTKVVPRRGVSWTGRGQAQGLYGVCKDALACFSLSLSLFPSLPLSFFPSHFPSLPLSFILSILCPSLSLFHQGAPNGVFFLRDSTSSAGDFVMSVR